MEKQKDDGRETAKPCPQPDPKAGYTTEPAHTKAAPLPTIGSMTVPANSER